MKLEQIKKEWKKDSVPDITNLSGEALRITQLHSKYFNIIVDERRKQRLCEIEYNRLKKIKREYYLGRVPRNALKKLGWEPIEHEIRPSDVGDYLKGDSDLCVIEKKQALHDIKIEFLKDIIKAIHNRGLHIKSAIDWQKFTHGES